MSELNNNDKEMKLSDMIQKEVVKEQEKTTNDSVVEIPVEEKTEEKVIAKSINGKEVELPKEALERDTATPVETMGKLDSLVSNMEAEAEEAKKKYEIYEAEQRQKEREARILASQKEEFHDKIIEEESEKSKEPAKDLTSIKIKKTKNIVKKFDSILNKKRKEAYSTKVILPNSGYTASIVGMTAPEIRTASETMAKLDKFGYLDYKYKNLYKKIVETSVGEITYDTFLRRTALLEYEILSYGLFASTYPDVNEYPFNCPKCGCQTTFKFNNQEFLDVEFDVPEEEYNQMNDEEKARFKVRKEKSKKTIEAMTQILKGQTIDAQELFDEASTNKLTRKLLPDSKIIVDLRHPTLYNQLFDVVQKLSEDIINNNAAVVNMLPFISKVYFPDPDSEDMEDPDYLELDDVTQQIQALNTIDDSDDEELSKAIVENIMEKYVVTYSLKAPKCKCGYKPEPTRFQFDELLFTMRQIQSIIK